MGNRSAGAGAHDIRVLVENGEYWLRNRGDIAMMAVTVQRLRERWPAARIGMLTDQPRILRALLPQAEPICLGTGGDWGNQTRTDRLLAPAALRWRAATDGPKSRLRPIRNALRGTGNDAQTPPEPPLPAAAATATLVLAQGGGYMTDVDLYQAHRTLNLLEYAQSQGIPTAMIGQGFGPIDDPRLRERAARVLPGVDFIGLREARRGPRLLDEFGVAPERIAVTGDDAVESAYRMRRPDLGTDLGICLRVTYYAQVSDTARGVLGAVMRARAAAFDATLAPLIISEYDAEDRKCTLSLLTGAHARPPVGRGGTADDVARQVSRCRVVVTSAYHLAVFALSQGIPAVGLTASRYYDDKFYGLAQMFGTGLRVVHLDDPDLESVLTTSISELWQAAPDMRDPLQRKAVEQIDSARAGMERVYQFVEGVRTAAQSDAVQGDK